MKTMKASVLAFSLLIAVGPLGTQPTTWQTSPGHTQIPIWPGTVPNARPGSGAETLTTHTGLVAGKTWSYIQNVSRPTLTVGTRSACGAPRIRLRNGLSSWRSG
jgi:hypothetical protein